jgi:hypothetical protein
VAIVPAGASVTTRKVPRVCIRAVREARRALDLEIAAFDDPVNLSSYVNQEVPILDNFRSDTDDCRANGHSDDTKRGQSCLGGQSEAEEIFRIDGEAFDSYLAGDSASIYSAQDQVSPHARKFGRYWAKCTRLSGDQR